MTTPRQLFLRLLHRDIDAESLALAHGFVRQAGLAPPTPGGAGGQGEQYPNDLPERLSEQQLATALDWIAPTALLQWDWLRRIGHAGASHRPANAALFAAYMDAVGLHDPSQALAAQYRALLTQAGLHTPALSRLAADPATPEAVLLAPCLSLALSELPASRFTTLFGYTLAHCQDNSCWLDWLERQLQKRGLPTGYCRRQRELREKHLPALLALTQSLHDPSGLDSGRLLYRHGQSAFTQALCGELTAASGPCRQTEALLQHTRPYAVGHHGRVMLQGRSLDEWLAEGDWPALRQALRQSGLDGALMRSLAFGGPMFGVFGEKEQSLLRQWLEADFSSYPHRGGGEKAAIDSDAAMPRDAVTPPSPRRREGTGGKPAVRELYHRLLNRERFPDCLPAAARYAETVLARTAWLAPLQTGLRRGFSYSPETFYQRVDAIYRREMSRYRPLAGPPRLSRELCLWGIRQMAPAILLDGCWLENLAGAEPAQDEVRRRLLRTFADEIGAGLVEQNHPRIYLELLASQDIRLPPVDSREFAEEVCLDKAAFPLPAYLLAIGAWPERFFPELLGLNLAIELSGLGASYMHLADTLRYHGIDPAIVRLHLSIDNLASGHAALARECIEIYLERVGQEGGPSARQSAWRRVWTGYLSLATASIPFAWAGLREYGRRWPKNRPKTA